MFNVQFDNDNVNVNNVQCLNGKFDNDNVNVNNV